METASARSFQQIYRDPHQRLSAQVVKDCVDGILLAAQPWLKKPVKEISVLDVGSGTGEYAFEFETRVGRVVAVEPDLAAVEQARRLKAERNSQAQLVHGFIEEVKITQTFDLAVSLTTVEHMPEARRSFERILSVLNPGGILYLTAPNKLWPIECHYHLPFLSYLPLPLANLYLRMTGRGTSYQDCSYMRTYWGMKRLFHGLDCEVSFVVPDLSNSYVGVGDTNPLRRWIRNNGIALIGRFPIFWVISKGFIMIIRKKI